MIHIAKLKTVLNVLRTKVIRMNEWEIYEPNWEKCPYCECIYSEYDTGYREYGCSYIGDAKDMECGGGELDNECPLAFKYQIEE